MASRGHRQSGTGYLSARFQTYGDTIRTKEAQNAASALLVREEARGMKAVDASPMPDSLVELVAARLRVLGQPLRIRVIDHLMRGSATVQELADALGVVQQNVSQHLNILHQAGILTRCREGSRVRYALDDPHVLPLFEQAAASIAYQAEDLVRRIEPNTR